MLTFPVNVGEAIFAYFDDKRTPPSDIDLPTFKKPLNEVSDVALVAIKYGDVALPKNDGFETETFVFN
jgi:hypothetical protein